MRQSKLKLSQHQSKPLKKNLLLPLGKVWRIYMICDAFPMLRWEQKKRINLKIGLADGSEDAFSESEHYGVLCTRSTSAKV